VTIKPRRADWSIKDAEGRPRGAGASGGRTSMGQESERLEPRRVAAAARMWSRASELVRAERALFALQGCVPGFGADVTLLKVVALATLDGGRCFSAARWAGHAHAIMAGCDPRAAGPELVERLADAAGTGARERSRALTLASRFAHYFVDVDRFPVRDAWTERELGRLAPGPAPERAGYVGFAERHARVAAELGLARPRHLWCYLWLAGQYRSWSRNPRTPIHRAARALFESRPPELELLASSAAEPARRAA
jgi:hypothetical protein